jgi:flagellar hook assembly protein FlgD
MTTTGHLLKSVRPSAILRPLLPTLFATLVAALLLPVAGPGSALASVGISGLDASPDPFSPNGDGTRDSTLVSFTLETDEPSAFVWVTVTDSEDKVVIRLAEAESGEPGRIEKVWMGQTSSGDAAPDGIYTFEVKARAGADSTPVLARNVQLDTTAPIIEAVRPYPSPYAPLVPGDAPGADSLLTIDIDIAGSNAGDWLTAVITVPGDPVTLCTPALSGTDSTYACAWDGREYEDGVYILEVSTHDPAGNRASSSHSIDLDLEPPELTIDYPDQAVMDTFPDQVRGSFYDRNDVDSIGFRFHGRMDYIDVTVPAPCCPYPWVVEWPDSLKRDGEYTLEIYAVDVPGYIVTVTHVVSIKTEPSDAPTIAPVPEQVSDPVLTVTGRGGAGDSLFVFLNGSVEARTTCTVSGTFAASLNLDLGINEIYAVSRDVAGHYSDPSETVTVEYLEQMGITVEEKLDGPAAIEINLTREADRITLRIFSLTGTYVRTVVENNPKQFGEMEWDLTDADGELVKNGPYVLVFEIRYSDGSTDVEKLAVVVAR